VLARFLPPVTPVVDLATSVGLVFSRNLNRGLCVSISALISTTLCDAEPTSRPNEPLQNATPARDCLVPGYDDHCEDWVSVYDNRNGHTTEFDGFIGVEEGRAQAIGPQGKRVYVTGYSWDNATQSPQFATVAFDTSNGARLWVARHGGAGITSYAYDIAVSPDGSRVYVTGQQYRQQQGSFFSEGTTIAYDAATGRQLWLARYEVPFADAELDHVAISPDGTTVYVSGGDAAGGDFGRGEVRYVLIAYSASTGDRRWAAFHDNPQAQEFLYTMVLDPTGARVYLGGDAGIVAYNAANGVIEWEVSDQAHSLAVVHDGSRLFATRQRGIFGGDFDLVAYAAATGKSIWSSPLPHTFDSTPPLVAGPGGARVYVATTQDVPGSYAQNLNVVTMAFEANSGVLAWTANHDDPRFTRNGPIGSEEHAWGMTASPDGKRLYVAARGYRPGPSESYAEEITTIAYSAADGSQKWVGRYRASPQDFDIAADPFPAAHSIAVTPDGSKVIVPGFLNHQSFVYPGGPYSDNSEDYVVLAYDAQLAPEVRPLKAVSRKVHGAAGAFDLVGVESRSGGPDHLYQMVVTFPRAVTFGAAAITSGIGSVASTNVNGRDVTINLIGVTNAQTITLTLSDVSDGQHTNDVTLELSVLIGDVTGSGSVRKNVDAAIVQNQTGKPITNANFREDVTADGVIDDADVSLVKSKTGTVLPEQQ